MPFSRLRRGNELSPADPAGISGRSVIGNKNRSFAAGKTKRRERAGGTFPKRSKHPAGTGCACRKGQSCNDVPGARWGNSGGVGCADHTDHEVGRVSPLLILFGDFCPILRAKWQKSPRPIGTQGFAAGHGPRFWPFLCGQCGHYVRTALKPLCRKGSFCEMRTRQGHSVTRVSA